MFAMEVYRLDDVTLANAAWNEVGAAGAAGRVEDAPTKDDAFATEEDAGAVTAALARLAASLAVDASASAIISSSVMASSMVAQMQAWSDQFGG